MHGGTAIFFLRYSDVDERNKKEGITCINGQLKFDPGLCKGAAFCCTFFYMSNMVFICKLTQFVGLLNPNDFAYRY
jgi:hypothetical protein